jgi:hypothetical protein
LVKFPSKTINIKFPTKNKISTNST